MKKVISALLLATAINFNLPAFAADPSLHEVYQAANGLNRSRGRGGVRP